jgi:mono/diheme cytochrome c family protein
MNKAIQFLTFVTLGCSSFIVSADAGSDKDKLLEHGEKMHTDHCYKCHTDSVYTRDNRFVKSLNALGKQVVRCKDNTGAPWFDEDTDAVVHFLNEKYYKF